MHWDQFISVSMGTKINSMKLSSRFTDVRVFFDHGGEGYIKNDFKKIIIIIVIWSLQVLYRKIYGV